MRSKANGLDEREAVYTSIGCGDPLSLFACDAGVTRTPDSKLR